MLYRIDGDGRAFGSATREPVLEDHVRAAGAANLATQVGRLPSGHPFVIREDYVRRRAEPVRERLYDGRFFSSIHNSPQATGISTETGSTAIDGPIVEHK